MNHKQAQTTNKLLLIIAGELAIVNAKKHLANKTNNKIIENIENLSRDITSEEFIDRDWVPTK